MLGAQGEHRSNLRAVHAVLVDVRLTWDRVRSRRTELHDGSLYPRPGARDAADDVKMAKDLGLKPSSLIKNIPSPREPWKAPVREWVREM